MRRRPHCSKRASTWPPSKVPTSSTIRVARGALLPPIVVDRVPHTSELVMEETFGPIIPIVRAPDDDEALIALSNSTAFGLSSGVCTNSFPRMQKYIAGLQVGTVNIWEVPGYRIERCRPLRRHQGQRQWLQGRRHRGDEELHQCEDIFAALVLS